MTHSREKARSMSTRIFVTFFFMTSCATACLCRKLL